MYKKIKWAYIIVLSFMFVYAFPIYGPVNSAILSAVLILLLLMFNGKALKTFLDLLRTRGFIYFLLTYLLFLLLVVLFTTAKGAYDFSMMRTLLNNIFSLFICAALVAIVFKDYKNYELSSIIVIILILQSLFIMMMILVPDLREMIQPYIQSESNLERMATYGGVRGLALSGSVAFGISVTMGSMGFVLHYWFATVGKNVAAPFKLLIFIIALFASLSAGRTAILGFVLGFYIYMFYYSWYILLKAYIKYLVITLTVLTAFWIYVLNTPDLLKIFNTYALYVFQFIFNYLDTGSFSVSSVEKLESMYFYPPSDNVFLGDGYYTAVDGSYYMHTDAGYMRYTLFFGLIGSSVVYFSLLLLLMFYMLKLNTFHPFYKYFIVGFIFLFLIYHYKGDVILWNVGFMKVFTLMVFFEYLKYIDLKRIKCNTTKNNGVFLKRCETF
jgi:hypothetical protein